MIKLKYIFQVILFSSTLFIASAQNLNPSAYTIAINSRMYLYIGFANPVKLNIGGMPYDQLNFKCVNGRVKNDGRLTITPLKAGDVELEAYRGTAIVARLHFTAVRVPDPRAGINGKSRGLISRAELLQAGKLEIFGNPEETIQNASNLPYSSLFEITGFTVSGKTRDGYNLDRRSNSEQFTAEITRMIKSFNKGDKIYFEDIRAKTAFGGSVELGTIVFKISD